MSTVHQSDVIVIGAGLSGIACAYHMLRRNPGLSLTMLEQRGDVGGTWDFYHYPGLRSDSDMHTYGFSFNRWPGDQCLASGSEIQDYIRDTWRKFGLAERTEFNRQLVSARWSSETACWTLRVCDVQDGGDQQYECRFLLMCAGYFAYDEGYTPAFEGINDFKGRIIHPQAWEDDLDYAGKRMIVIGSGATAVTLVPSLAERARHVTMLQRSPGYMMSRSRVDVVAKALNRVLPSRPATWLHRWRWGLLTALYFKYCRKYPQKAANDLINAAHSSMGALQPKTELTPRYFPWEQRLCAVQDGDLFEQIAQGNASLVTGEIDRFTPDGIRLRDGTQIDADIIVTATGFNVRLMGGADIVTDGQPVDLAECTAYRDTMYTGIPNLATTIGYFNNSWTLKAELQGQLVARIVEHLNNEGWDICQPREAEHEPAPMPYFTPGYLLRSAHLFPRNGANSPWNSHQNFPLDVLAYRFGRIDHDALRFSRKTRAQTA